MYARPSSRILQASRAAFRSTNLRQPVLRRNVQTAADSVEAKSGFQKFWDSPVGPKTVHFWAPIMKWGLVIAGIADFARPVENLSLSQNGALMATGAIWTRWCLIIKPKNIFLATVNFFLGCVGVTQVSRILYYRSTLKNAPSPVEEVKQEVKQAAKLQ